MIPRLKRVKRARGQEGKRANDQTIKRSNDQTIKRSKGREGKKGKSEKGQILWGPEFFARLLIKHGKRRAKKKRREKKKIRILWSTYLGSAEVVRSE